MFAFDVINKKFIAALPFEDSTYKGKKYFCHFA